NPLFVALDPALDGKQQFGGIAVAVAHRAAERRVLGAVRRGRIHGRIVRQAQHLTAGRTTSGRVSAPRGEVGVTSTPTPAARSTRPTRRGAPLQNLVMSHLACPKRCRHTALPRSPDRPVCRRTSAPAPREAAWR